MGADSQNGATAYGPEILRAALIGLIDRVTDCRSTSDSAKARIALSTAEASRVPLIADRTVARVPLRYERSRVQEIQAATRW
jgi:hypothetical protein